MWNDGIACIVTLAVAVSLVESVKSLARQQLLSSPVSRKVMHIVCARMHGCHVGCACSHLVSHSSLCRVQAVGQVYLMCWPLFSAAPEARLWAAIVPSLVTANFVLVGLGVLNDEGRCNPRNTRVVSPCAHFHRGRCSHVVVVQPQCAA